MAQLNIIQYNTPDRCAGLDKPNFIVPCEVIAQALSTPAAAARSSPIITYLDSLSLSLDYYSRKLSLYSEINKTQLNSTPIISTQLQST